MCLVSYVLHILTTIGPALRTLTLHLFHHYGELIFSDALHFPELRDLTIHSSTLLRTTPLGPQVPAKFPCLRRLHIIQRFPLSQAPAQVVSSLGSPLLTHLRLSRVLPNNPSLEEGIVQDLRHIVQPNSRPSDVPSTARFPLTLEQVLIQSDSDMILVYVYEVRFRLSSSSLCIPRGCSYECFFVDPDDSDEGLAYGHRHVRFPGVDRIPQARRGSQR